MKARINYVFELDTQVEVTIEIVGDEEDFLQSANENRGIIAQLLLDFYEKLSKDGGIGNIFLQVKPAEDGDILVTISGAGEEELYRLLN